MSRKDCIIATYLEKFHLFKQTQKKGVVIFNGKKFTFSPVKKYAKKLNFNIAKSLNIYQIKDFS